MKGSELGPGSHRTSTHCTRGWPVCKPKQLMLYVTVLLFILSICYLCFYYITETDYVQCNRLFLLLHEMELGKQSA
jgi:hypothetical protein